MVKRTGPTNYQLQELIAQLKPKAVHSRFWKKIVEDITLPTRQRRIVNLYTIEHDALDGETVLVPGKVLSMGELHKKVHVAAINFSGQARQKILSAQGSVLSIEDLLRQNPEGKNVRILG